MGPARPLGAPPLLSSQLSVCSSDICRVRLCLLFFSASSLQRMTIRLLIEACLETADCDGFESDLSHQQWPTYQLQRIECPICMMLFTALLDEWISFNRSFCFNGFLLSLSYVPLSLALRDSGADSFLHI